MSTPALMTRSIMFTLICVSPLALSFLFRSPILSFRPRAGLTHYALREGSAERIEALRFDLAEIEAALESDLDEDVRQQFADRLAALNTVFSCVDALRSIETDLSLFDEHIQGDNERLITSALVFKEEFTQCKRDIESQLEKILWGSSDEVPLDPEE